MPKCQFCNTELTHVFCDLHHQPPSNSLLTNLEEPEVTYPLKVYVCTSCWLVQLPEIKKAGEIFKEDYPYFSSQSPSNVSHAKEFVEMICKRFDPLTVLEIGSNDGYMLKWFKDKGCIVQGIDPSRGPASAAIKNNIPTVCQFFHKTQARYMPKYQLVCSINTIAHQPRLNSFVEGMKIVLSSKGVITAEFPHLMKLIEMNQFDTIYLEHYNYFSFRTISRIFLSNKLEIFDVEELPEHGGSLRIYAQHLGGGHIHTNRVGLLEDKEMKAGIPTVGYYEGFQKRVEIVRLELMDLLLRLKSEGKIVVAYGAAAKGATLLNYCGIRSDMMGAIYDRSPHKIGKYLPGSHIRIVDPRMISERRPDRILILPWNLKDEIMRDLSFIRDWGAKFIVPIPEVKVL